jgi:hypothetical protein
LSQITLLYFLKVLRAQLELGQVRQEIDRRLAEKEEEFNNSRFPSQLYILTCPKTNLPKKVSYNFPSVPHCFSYVNVLDSSFELAFPNFFQLKPTS